MPLDGKECQSRSRRLFTFVWRWWLLILRFQIPGCVEMPEALALGRGDLHSCVAFHGRRPHPGVLGLALAREDILGSSSEACRGLHDVMGCLPSTGLRAKP